MGRVASQLSLSFSNCARFYALPKVHKPAFPYCPKVSNIGIACYRLAKVFTTIFSLLFSANIHSFKSSINFTKIIQDFPSSILIMVSFDVKSLFTNIPICGALSCLKRRLKMSLLFFEIEESITFAHTCLTQTIFFQEQFYKQSEGLEPFTYPILPINKSPFTYPHRHTNALIWKHSLRKNIFPVLDTLLWRHIYIDWRLSALSWPYFTI